MDIDFEYLFSVNQSIDSGLAFARENSPLESTNTPTIDIVNNILYDRRTQLESNNATSTRIDN